MIDHAVLQPRDDSSSTSAAMSDGVHADDQDGGEFRAGLLYIAADLRALAQRAPEGRAAEVVALSHLVARLAVR